MPDDKKERTRARFLVEGVDMGDGEPVTAWLEVRKEEIVVREYRTPRDGRTFRKWSLPLSAAANALCVFAQRYRLASHGIKFPTPTQTSLLEDKR